MPIPPCYLSENEDCELDVIDGQQRLYSLYRFIKNQLKLTGLNALIEYNGKHFFELPSKEQRRLKTYTLRCVVIKNESHPEIKFDVFQRLNTNTVPLNPQELRNCIYRGALNNLLGELSLDSRWLEIRAKKAPNKRLADEEMILRFFAFHLLGLDTYKTPLKSWLNDAALKGRKFTPEKIDDLKKIWNKAIDVVYILFQPKTCFRRSGSTTINRALFDLVMSTARKITPEQAQVKSKKFRGAYDKLNENEEFQDLISRSVDHKSRTRQRFALWDAAMKNIFD